jgi:hypothetical protein
VLLVIFRGGHVVVVLHDDAPGRGRWRGELAVICVLVVIAV